MSEKVIEVSGLQNSYKENHVLKGVSFTIRKGSIFALLGSNGAGKTTVVRVGFLKKSIIWTLVTSIILVSLFGNSVTLSSNFVLPIFLAVGTLLMVICLILFIGLLKKVNKMECL